MWSHVAHRLVRGFALSGLRVLFLNHARTDSREQRAARVTGRSRTAAGSADVCREILRPLGQGETSRCPVRFRFCLRPFLLSAATQVINLPDLLQPVARIESIQRAALE